MEKLNIRGQKNSNERVNQLIEENESLKAIVSDYSELKKFAEEVVEKHNDLVNEYKSKQTELIESKETEQSLRAQLEQKDEEIQTQKDLTAKLEQRLVDFQNHINNLIDKFQSLEEVNKKHENTISSLEKYIEIMDTAPKTIKNERGAGRKKKYTQEQIDLVLDAKNKGEDYEFIVAKMNKEFSDKAWEIKEIKYIYSRYKSL